MASNIRSSKFLLDFQWLRKRFSLTIALSIASLFFFSQNLNSQGWQIYPSFQTYDFAKDALPTPDGGYLIVGHTGLGPDLHDVFLQKLDPFGNEQWRRIIGSPAYEAIDDMTALPDGSFVLAGERFILGGGNAEVYLVKVDQLGQVVWEKTIGTNAFEYGRKIIQTSDGGFAIVGRYDNGADVGILVIKTDGDGNEIWSNIYGGTEEDEGWGITETADNQLVVAGVTRSFGQGERDIYLLSIGLDATFNWVQTFGGANDELGTSVIPTSDGGLLVGGATASFGAGFYDVYLIKTDASGNAQWEKTYGGTDGEWGAYLLQTPESDFVVAGSAKSFGNIEDDFYLFKTDPNGNLLWQNTYGQSSKEIPHSLELTSDGGFIMSGHSRTDNPDGSIQTSQSFVVKTNSAGVAYSNYFSGKIFDDSNNDCLFQTGERGFENWVITAISTSSNKRFYGLSGADGSYSILTDTGGYTLHLAPLNGYWQPCENDISLEHLGFYDTLVANFALQVGTVCPQLEVDIATSVLRPCETAVYQVRYCNNGTATAINTLVEITVDGTTTPFNVGDLLPGGCGSFSLDVPIDCNFETGRTHCVEARISPNQTCLPDDPLWDKSSMELSASCIGDSVEFTIKNIGTGNMSGPLGFIIIEDQIMTRGLNIQLNSGETRKEKHPANGKTIRMQTEQPKGHPGKGKPSVSVEGCTISGPISKGFVTMWPEDDTDPFKSIDCRENIYHIPYNDKLAFPKGIGNEHLIQPGTDIEYLIHFQNTGEDTISTVVIQDTLSPLLDLTTLRPGAGSHPYFLEISNTGVLQFTFENIALPDSTTNEMASHGFVKFRAGQLPNAPAGSLIINRSCVTFEYGPPVAKPYYFHTLNQPQIFSISDVNLCTGGIVDGVAISGDTTLFFLENLPAYDSLQFTNVIAWPVYEIFQQDTTCENEPYFFVDEWLEMPGIFDTTLMTIMGCDSSVTLELAHREVPHFIFQDSTCENEPYFFNGELIEMPGTYDAFFSAANGCDSIVTLELSIDTLLTNTLDTAIGYGAEFLGINLFSDTILTEIVLGNMGCDTVVVWAVNVSTGTKNPVNNNNLKIFPSPASDFIYFKLNGPINIFDKISIYNSQGVLLKNINAPFLAENKIEIVDLPGGIYYILAHSEKGVFGGEFLKE